MKRTLIAAALVVATAAAPAFAVSEKFSMDVEYSRANLATAAGAAAEYANIRNQVAERCEAEHAGMNFAKSYAVKFCTQQTLAKAIRKIDVPNLTAVHAQQR
jgi:UrcA family protein